VDLDAVEAEHHVDGVSAQSSGVDDPAGGHIAPVRVHSGVLVADVDPRDPMLA
jgi:hypothetical protein